MILVLALAARSRPAARSGWRHSWCCSTIVQGMLPSLRSTAPLVAALHPVNALLLMGVTAAIARVPRADASGVARQARDTTGSVGAERLSAVASPR